MKLEIFDTYLNAWLDCSGYTIEQVRAEAERCEVLYKVDGVTHSWKEEI